MHLRCNAVLEGGGVRGIGHVGVAWELERAGYQFEYLVGSSAGAIVASLLAVGYTAEEIKQEMESLDYLQFRQEGFLSRLGTVGKLVSLYHDFGIYQADKFMAWLTGMLEKKGKTTFGDIRMGGEEEEPFRYLLQVTASDVTDQKLLIFPRDLKEFGLDPDAFSLALAVRMSMGIPFFYKPFPLFDSQGKKHLIVDGGLLSNYPLWLLENTEDVPPYPTFGFKFIGDEEDTISSSGAEPTITFGKYVKMVGSTVLDAADKQHISESRGDFARTIAIPIIIEEDGKPKKIRTTDFDITKVQSCLLFQNGVQSARAFLSHWNFNQWKQTYRGKDLSSQ